MGSQQLIAVADTGPLIHLAEVDCLPLLNIFDEIHIPDAVWEEALNPIEIRRQLRNSPRYTPDATHVASFIQEQDFQSLHFGERQALYLCRDLGVNLILTDDLAVRDAAQRLGITPVGSLGIISRACFEGVITFNEAEKALIGLYETSSLYVTRSLVESVVEQLSRAFQDLVELPVSASVDQPTSKDTV